LKNRWYSHRSQLRCGRHPNVNLQAWFALVGEDGFSFEKLVEGLSKEAAHSMEERLIQTAESLNIGLHAVGGDNLTRHPDREKIIQGRVKSQRAMLRKLTAEERAALFGRCEQENGMYGRSHTEEVRVSQSARLKGNNYSAGRVMSEQQKKQLSDNASLRVGSLNPFFGKQHTEATKRKLSVARFGMSPTNCRKVLCDGVEFVSATEAARTLEVCTATILFRIKSKHWNYSYA